MEENYFYKIAKILHVNAADVEKTIHLLDTGATIPFIARYRKEQTGSMDEVKIGQVRDLVESYRELDKRRNYILKIIEGLGKLTDELKGKIDRAETISVLEDLYLPYKPKRRTKATIAREKGLEPLAILLFGQGKINPESEAAKFINKEKEVNTIEDAFQGARDIIAEWINEDISVRKSLRRLFFEKGILRCRIIKGKEEEGMNYMDYFEYEEPVSKIPGHRMLAIRRGEHEGILSVDIQPTEGDALHAIETLVVKPGSASSEHIQNAAKDAYKRLIKPSMETEVRLEKKQIADAEAIRVFSVNLRQLLMAPPLGQKCVMAIDPGFRTGCKVVCLDRQGRLLEYITIYPNEPQKELKQSAAIILALAQKYKIEAIAIGNGTAGRETEAFVRSAGFPPEILILMVNESGASIYSASDIAREEFPDFDATVRGSVSIGRRLMDPLAELVKIESKSIGVGQYQHDVDQAALRRSLDEVVMSCVNQVGVELNTASKELLSYVSGLGPQLAGNIISYRNSNGPFSSRNELKKVARMGDKAFEQCAGFLRIRNGRNPLDASAVHPERYSLVEKMAMDNGCTIEDLMIKEEKRSRLNLEKYISGEVGLPTLKDIINELQKPGRDPRDQFEVFNFDEGVREISDLKVGMKLPGIITNITGFGAFVDIGVHQDGLVHISHLADRFVSDAMMAVTVQQKVMVTVLEVDAARKRISLSMKSDPFGKEHAKKKDTGKQSGEDAGGDLQVKLNMLKGKFRK